MLQNKVDTVKKETKDFIEVSLGWVQKQTLINTKAGLLEVFDHFSSHLKKASNHQIVITEWQYIASLSHLVAPTAKAPAVSESHIYLLI